MRIPSEKARAWRASLVAATSLAVAIGLAAAPAGATAGASRAPAAAAAVTSRVTYIGAFAGTLGKSPIGQWNLAYSEIGPLQSDKIFYGTGKPKPLPPTFSGSVCAGLKNQPVCVIAYKTASKSTLQSFVESMPKQRSSPVIMVYWQEPELGKSISAATFKTNFDLRSQWVRQAVQQAKAKGKDLSYVKVAMDSATSGYANTRSPGYYCSYFPAASNVDDYLADVYEHRLTSLKDKADFQRWNQCVAKNGTGKPQGLAEYGLGVCTKDGAPATELQREQTLAGDAGYLAKNFPHLLLWEYWWSTISGSRNNPCAHSKFGAKSVTATEWKKIEAGTVPS